MTILFAQPYDLDATGFYFTSAEDYAAKIANLRNAFGQPIEEVEIQLIEADRLDIDLFEALSVHQGNIEAFFEAVSDWSDDDKIKIIIAVGEAGYKFNLGSDAPSDIEIDLYEIESLKDLAIQFVDEGLFGDIPENIRNYLDFDAIARDLAIDYCETIIAGTRYVYRCE